MARSSIRLVLVDSARRKPWTGHVRLDHFFSKSQVRPGSCRPTRSDRGPDDDIKVDSTCISSSEGTFTSGTANGVPEAARYGEENGTSSGKVYEAFLEVEQEDNSEDDDPAEQENLPGEHNVKKVTQCWRRMLQNTSGRLACQTEKTAGMWKRREFQGQPSMPKGSTAAVVPLGRNCDLREDPLDKNTKCAACGMDTAEETLIVRRAVIQIRENHVSYLLRSLDVCHVYEVSLPGKKDEQHTRMKNWIPRNENCR